MIYILVMTVHVLVCLFLIVVVLLQSGKAADLAGAFGGMGSQTAFGPRGSATLLSKATTISAIVFMLTSMTLSILGTRAGGGGSTVLDQAAPKSAPITAPAPAPPPVSLPGNVNGTTKSITVTPQNGKPTEVPVQMPAQTPAQQTPPKK